MGYFKERNTVWGWLHFILGIIHLAFGIGVWGGLSDSIDITGQEIYFMQPAIIKTDDEAGFSVQIEKTHIGVISPILIHAIVSILTGFSHLISHYYYKEYGVCTSRPNHIRWTEYSITATLMTLSAYVSLGEGNILFLVSAMLMGVLLQGCGWLIEKYCQLQEADDSPQKGGRKWLVWYWFFLIGLIVEVAIVVPLIVLTAKMENKKDGINESLIIYTIYYSLFAVNSFYDAHVMTQVTNSEFVDSTKIDKKTNKNYVLDRAFMLSDERYAVLSFTSKIALDHNRHGHAPELHFRRGRRRVVRRYLVRDCHSHRGPLDIYLVPKNRSKLVYARIYKIGFGKQNQRLQASIPYNHKHKRRDQFNTRISSSDWIIPKSDKDIGCRNDSRRSSLLILTLMFNFSVKQIK